MKEWNKQSNKLNQENFYVNVNSDASSIPLFFAEKA